MKKIIFTLFLLVSSIALFADSEEFLFINKGRETFIHFPSTNIGNTHTLTVFYPEDYTPLTKTYPLVVVLGIEPRQATEVNEFVKKNQVVVAGLDFTSEDFINSDKIITFVKAELLPYLETNYPVYTEPHNRVIVSPTTAGVETANQLLNVPNLFGSMGAVLYGNKIPSFSEVATDKRIFVVGNEIQLARVQEQLTNGQLRYGRNFVLKREDEISKDKPLQYLNSAYFFADETELEINKIIPMLSLDRLKLESSQVSHLGILVQLKTGNFYTYIPTHLKIGPHFLNWDNLTSTLTVLPGAEKGTVRISHLDSYLPNFKLKIRLYK